MTGGHSHRYIRRWNRTCTVAPSLESCALPRLSSKTVPRATTESPEGDCSGQRSLRACAHPALAGCWRAVGQLRRIHTEHCSALRSGCSERAQVWAQSCEMRVLALQEEGVGTPACDTQPLHHHPGLLCRGGGGHGHRHRDLCPGVPSPAGQSGMSAGVGSGAGQGAGSRALTMGNHTVYRGLAERKQGNGAFADSIR